MHGNIAPERRTCYELSILSQPPYHATIDERQNIQTFDNIGKTFAWNLPQLLQTKRQS
jgi:hypothetical protein